jgi:hypothetical protein
VDQGVDLLLGADVDAAGRLVEDQHARLARQPAAQDHLLLVAAGEGAGGLFERAQAHPQVVDHGAGPRRLPAARQPAPRGQLA